MVTPCFCEGIPCRGSVCDHKLSTYVHTSCNSLPHMVWIELNWPWDGDSTYATPCYGIINFGDFTVVCESA